MTFITQKGIYILFSIFTIVSCKKTESYISNAQIIGVDQKTCPCCGGTEITIDNVPYPAGNNYFLAGQLPADFSLGVNPTFPIAVKLNWIIDTTVCFGKYIKVSKIARR